MAEDLPIERDWAEIPYFRKSWFMGILFLAFMPACLMAMWTGDIYYRKQGRVYRTNLQWKITLTLVIAMLILSALIRQLH